MEQGQLSALLPVSSSAHRGVNFRQGKDLLRQSSKGRLAYATHLRGHTPHICPTGDKAVVPLLPLARGVVTDAVFVPLAFVPVLLHVGLRPGMLFLQFPALFFHDV